MEKIWFLYSRNRFYKTDTRSRIPPMQTNCMSEVRNGMKSNQVFVPWKQLGKKKNVTLLSRTEYNNSEIRFSMLHFKSTVLPTSLSFVSFQLLSWFTLAVTFLSSCHKSALIPLWYKQKFMHVDTYLVFILNWGSLAYHLHLKVKLTLKIFQLLVYGKLLLGPSLWYRKSLSFCWVPSVWRHLWIKKIL